jgi:hypothetical protein
VDNGSGSPPPPPDLLRLGNRWARLINGRAPPRCLQNPAFSQKNGILSVRNHNKFYGSLRLRGILLHLWDYVRKPGTARQATDGNIKQRMLLSCWITKPINTNSEYVILIAFPRQQWLRERVSMLRHTYTACLIIGLCAINKTESNCIIIVTAKKHTRSTVTVHHRALRNGRTC